MSEPLIIRYESEEGGFDLGVLGESFQGLNKLLNEMCDLTGIEGDIEVRTSRIEQGSVDLHTIFNVVIVNNPFSSPEQLFDFLRVASPEILHKAQAYFSDIAEAHRDINTYFRENTFDNDFLNMLIGAFIARAWSWAGKQKSRPTTTDRELGEITPRQADKLGGMVHRGRFRRVVKPIVQGNVAKIEVKAPATPMAVSAVTEDNIGDYLPEDAKILPDWENGSIQKLRGEVLGLSSTRGESIKIKVVGIDRSNSLLLAHPKDGQATEDFKDYYKKPVAFTAEVVRRTLYKRPELVILEMALLQEPLGL